MNLRNQIARACLGLAAFFAATTPSFASPACGRAFAGDWRTPAHRESGQITQMELFFPEHGIIMLRSDTREIVNRQGASFVIFEYMYHSVSGNISARRNSNGTCSLTFGRPSIIVDRYNAARHIISRRATLRSDSARSFTLCWGESGHMVGDCLRFDRTR